jgi:hypothetical protein
MYLKTKKALLSFSVLFFTSLGFLSPAHAETVLLPESHHLQYTTYGLFFEQQSMLIYKSGARAWGAVGITTALLEESDWLYKPQLVVHASANAAYLLNGSKGLLETQTIDARVGLALDLAFTESFRGMIMWEHQSGHISDDVQDAFLIGSNLGNEILWLRLIKDFDSEVRVGGSLHPVMGSDPGMMTWGSDQFFEIFPWKTSENPHVLSPFFAMGFDEYGRHEVDLTFHAQIGFAAGNHFSPDHHPNMRLVLGYYNGVDPRLKYFQFLFGYSNYAYGGVMFDI